MAYSKIHVFFDNSNIWGGAGALRQLNEPKAHWAAFRIHYRNLFKVIEKGRAVSESILAGSVPPSCEALWEYARKAGYGTDLLRRVEKDDGSFGEQGVDEMLHLRIANCIIDNDPPMNRVLVVATGDGRKSDFGTGFRYQIERALKKKWQVELWSWSPTLHSCYGGMCGQYPNLSVHSLDPFYYSVTFLQAGTYYDLVNGNRVPHPVSERIVAPVRQ